MKLTFRLFVSVIFFGLGVPSDQPLVAGQPPQKDSFPPVIVSENPSIVRVNSCFFPFLCGQRTTCVAFTVGARRDPISELQITSSGLGEATLSEGKGGVSNRCDNGNVAFLKVQGLDTKGRRIYLSVPLDSIANAGEKEKGNIVFVSGDYKPLLVPLELERSSQPMRTASLWFLGVAIPALITFWLTYWGARLLAARTKRVEETTLFTRHKNESRRALTDFFQNLYPELYRSDRGRFLEKLRLELEHVGTWRSIPSRELLRINQGFESGEIRRIQVELGKLYPDWKDEILNPR